MIDDSGKIADGPSARHEDLKPARIVSLAQDQTRRVRLLHMRGCRQGMCKITGRLAELPVLPKFVNAPLTLP